MIISDVIIDNFRCYYGRNEISFNRDGKITLIYGLSGFGKSSFLQFFRWMFYNDADFGEQDDKPLWNTIAYEEYKEGKPLSIYGQIDFEHLGVKYSLIRSQELVGSYGSAEFTIDSSHKLLMLVDDNWMEYSGDIYNKINTFLPKELSKYFLLDGEKAREIVLNSKELKQAIHSLFGLDAYANAISHIGTENKKKSVLGQCSAELASKMPGRVGNTGMTIQEMQENVQDMYDTLEFMKSERRGIIDQITEKSKRRDDILKTLGEATSKNTIEQLIKTNNYVIEQKEKEIKDTRIRIGNLFYRWYPYLILSEKSSACSTILREKNAELAKETRKVFQNLKKELLSEVSEKGVCICGRPLDEESKQYIENTLHSMPPNSYTYMFGQFISKTKGQIQQSQTKFIEYDELVDNITDCENKIIDLEGVNKSKIDELKRLDDAKDLIQEFEDIKKEIGDLSKKKSGYEGKIAAEKQIYEMSNKMLKEALRYAKVSEEYREKIELFKEVRKRLEKEKEEKELEVRSTLNNCVREIFKQLTTQKDIDADKIEFVNNDFSLRTTYLTGGQLAVDEYAYVIGMVKALQECNAENSENPIIIDAPFAFTDNEQSEHIFKTFPLISRQTVLLTLDVNKVRRALMENSNLYDLYILKTNSQQNKAKIERGSIDDIEF